MKNRNFSKFKKATIAALCAVSVTCTGLAAACAPSNEPEEPSDSKTQREDNQLLKNGNFEFSTVPEDAVHLIKNVNNWSRSGDSSGVMSGIVNTSKSAWELLTADDIKDKLDYNNDLSMSDPDYNDLHVDYNGMDSEDLLYVDSYAASFKTDDDVTDSDDIIAIHGTYKDFLGIEGDEESGYTYLGRKVYKKVQENPDEENAEFYFDEDCTKPVRYAMIENPETHLGAFDENAARLYKGISRRRRELFPRRGTYRIRRQRPDDSQLSLEQQIQRHRTALHLPEHFAGSQHRRGNFRLGKDCGP